MKDSGKAYRMTLETLAHKVIPVIFITTLFSTPAAAEDDIRGIASVIDGDTLEIHGQRIRLYGIDAPESSQTCDLNGTKWRCGQASALALSDQIAKQTISCKPTSTDRYGRKVAKCFLGQTNINAWLVENGWALDWPRYSKGAYTPHQRAAETSKQGIWKSSFTLPWEWRKRRRD